MHELDQKHRPHRHESEAEYKRPSQCLQARRPWGTFRGGFGESSQLVGEKQDFFTHLHIITGHQLEKVHQNGLRTSEFSHFCNCSSQHLLPKITTNRHLPEQHHGDKLLQLLQRARLPNDARHPQDARHARDPQGIQPVVGIQDLSEGHHKAANHREDVEDHSLNAPRKLQSGFGLCLLELFRGGCIPFDWQTSTCFS